MRNEYTGTDVVATFRRVADALEANSQYLTELDQAMGDGDLGITTTKIATALREYAGEAPQSALGKYVIEAGMAINRAAPSSMGTLLATALMRAGKAVRDVDKLTLENLDAMLTAANYGIQERGKAQPGDKTIVDALHPAAIAFHEAVTEGRTPEEASVHCLQAAQAGLDAATPLRSRIGRAGWVGERTEGQIDPGCALLVIVLKSIFAQ